jgi:O-methyltransferase
MTADARTLYLDLLKQCLLYSLWGDSWEPVRIAATREADARPGWRRRLVAGLDRMLSRKGLCIARRVALPPELLAEGRTWPAQGLTMIGAKRLDNLHACLETVLSEEVPGDFIETGVWRGGACIFMRGVLKAYGVADRIVWAADSFEGLPRPDPARYPADAGDRHHARRFLAVPRDQVEANFARYGLLDAQVRFLQGWFRDTLPAAPFTRLALARLDGDMYESTMDALVHLYPKLSPGAFVIVDDFALTGCRSAVLDFRARRGITDRIHEIDSTGIYWRNGP